jgi:ubiquinone/menaquinone biosynthesis C-methylase UbiE
MDSVFDVSTLITTLEFCEDPAKVLQEIGRVTQEKIFIGVLNSWSLLAFWRRIKGRFKSSIYNQACFLDIRKLRRMLKDLVTSDSMEWRGVCFLPYSKIRAFRWLDRLLSFRKNPFCAFLGLRITLKSGSSI